MPEHDRYVLVWAEKGSITTTRTGYGGGILCREGQEKLYWTVTCDAPTEHFASGKALLQHYDGNSDGVITQIEAAQALLDALEDVINIAEGIFVGKCYEDYAGVINDMCPAGMAGALHYSTKIFEYPAKTTESAIGSTGSTIAKISKDLAVGVCPIPTCTFEIT